jgi:hypothetical protein
MRMPVRSAGAFCLSALTAALLLGCASSPPPIVAGERPYDILIQNSRVLDGTGAPWFRADVAVRDGHIAAVGNLAGASAKEVIDARGQVLSPGFIDMHAHSDLSRHEQDHAGRDHRGDRRGCVGGTASCR